MARVLNGRYELHGVLGAGGAATVFRATDRLLGRDVAVKVLDVDAARSADPGRHERFVREARTGASLRHHNLVDVFDAGEDDGALYLVMELVHGQSLAALIAARAPMPVHDAVAIAAGMLTGVAALHAMGTIHRDVKPANVLVDDSGRVRLTDFGIAKRLDDIEHALTSHGMVIGTPSYLAPEQATGETLGPATDIYAVGIVLYEMLTGQRPAPAGCATCTSGGRSAGVDPRTVRPDVPDDVARAVIRATESDPARRFADADAMIDALSVTTLSVTTTTTGADAVTTALPIAAPAGVDPKTTTMPATLVASIEGGRRRSRVRPATLVAAAVVLVVLVGALVAAGRSDSDPSDSDVPAPVADEEVIVSIAPDDGATPSAPIEVAPPATDAPVVVAEPPPAGPTESNGDGGASADKAKSNGKAKGRKD